MRNFGSIIIAALFFLTACAQETPEITPVGPELANIIALHTEARGGKEAIENIRTRDLTLEITEPTFTVSGHYRASRDNQMRIDIFADGQRVFTEALGPDGGWQKFADGQITDLSPEGSKALERGLIANMHGLHELPKLGYTLELVGSTQRNNATFWEIKIIAPDGFAEHIFLDKDTFLITSKVKTSALHVDIDPEAVRQETFYSDYRESGGVFFSWRTETKNLDTNDVMQTDIIKSHDVNFALDPQEFLRPASEATQ